MNTQGVLLIKPLVVVSKIFLFDSQDNPLEFKPFKRRLKENEFFVIGENIKTMVVVVVVGILEW